MRKPIKTEPVVSFPSNLRFILLLEFQKPLLSFRNTFADGKSSRNSRILTLYDDVLPKENVNEQTNLNYSTR